MGVTIHELRAVISGNLVGFSQMVDGAISKTQSLRKAWGDFAADASRAANRIVNTFGLIGGAVTGAAVKMGFGFNSIKEQSEIAFTTMLGDGKKAKAFIAELTEFAARTPFELPGLLDSTKKLMAFGFEAEKIIPMLTVVGDAASGLGNPAAMDFIIRALGQIQAKGKVAAQEMNQLAEQGIPAWQALADKIGVSIPEAMKLAEQGAISSSVAIPAILEGMDAKFRGLMEKQSNSMSGLLSTMMDRLRGWTGTAFEPLYNSIRNGLGKLLSGDSLQMLDGFAQRIRGSMASVAAEIDAVFAADPSAFFASVGTVVEKVVQVFASLVGWFRQSSPEISKVASAVWGFIEPLLDFLREHPQILAALIALKITGFLGINSAVISLGSALLNTFTSMGKMAGASTTLGASLKGMGIALAISGIVLLAKKVYEASQAIQDYNRAVKESQRLDAAFDQKKGRERELKLRSLNEIENPEERKQRIEAELKKAKMEATGFDNQAKGASKNAEDFAATLTDAQLAAGNKVLESMNAEADRVAAQAREATSFVYQLEDQLHGLEKTAAPSAGDKGQSPGTPGGGSTPDGGIFDIPQDQLDAIHGAGEAKAEGKREAKVKTELDKFNAALDEAFGELPEERIEQMREQFAGISEEFVNGDITGAQFKSDLKKMTDEIDDATKKMEKAEQAQERFNAMLDQFAGQVPDDELAAWETAFADLREAFESGDITESQFKKGEGIINSAVGDSAEMQDKFGGLRESFGDETVDGWVDTFESLQDELRNGEVSAEVYKSELASLNQEIQRSTQAENDRTQFLGQMGNLQSELAAKKIQMPDSFWNSFNDRFSALTRQFTTGAISAQKFAQSTDALQREMDAAGNAAIKELQAKERARLLAGNFTQEEFQKAAEDRIIQMRMQQFDQYVEQAVNGMVGFNNGLQQINGGMQNFGNGMQQWGQGWGRNQYQFDPEQLRAAAATYGSFMATTAGQISGLLNNIALANERLSWSSIVYGDSIKGKDRWDLIANIEQWVRQIAELQTSPAPQFVSGLGSFQFNDPGLQTGQGANVQGGGNSFHFNFPNIDAVNSRTAAALADSVEQEMRRRGRRLF